MPAGFHWTGAEILVFTVPTAANVDPVGSPALLVRGSTTVEVLDGAAADLVTARG